MEDRDHTLKKLLNALSHLDQACDTCLVLIQASKSETEIKKLSREMVAINRARQQIISQIDVLLFKTTHTVISRRQRAKIAIVRFIGWLRSWL